MRQALLAAALILSGLAAAQDYPSKPIRLIVPFPAGTTPDTIGRTLGTRLSSAWGQPVVVENRPGAGGNIGTAEAARAAPDGYTLVIGSNGPIAVNKALYDKLPFDPDKDLQPVSLLATGAQLLAVHPSVPASDVRQLVEHARKNPDRLSYGSVGAGSASHLTMELLKSQAQMQIVHIPYKGFPAVVQDLMSGQIHATFAIVPAVLGQVKAGRLKGLAVTSARRSSLAPDVPTLAEQGFPHFDATAWNGLLAPAGVPVAVSGKLAAETQRIMRLAEVRELLGNAGFEVVGSSPEEFARFIRAEAEKWARIVRLTGARAE